MAMAVVVAAITRMSLDLHQATVDLLRLMGASEGYVGRQFEQHALANALRGSLAGFAAAVLMLAAAIALLRLVRYPACRTPSCSARLAVAGLRARGRRAADRLRRPPHRPLGSAPDALAALPIRAA